MVLLVRALWKMRDYYKLAPTMVELESPDLEAGGSGEPVV
jgi:hypothetical protein